MQRMSVSKCFVEYRKREAIKRRDNGEAHTAIARDFNVSHQTIGRLSA
jgi:hypothetical protein